ncbi:ser/Thr protein phosphatase [Podospora australis]|uniref:Ser/Thr protein phosphatase n=1 Tax=Podospora australis TaxID=1536484 RepID=A0AAN7AK25_9PEZI|nr:ser/Thr protein phosphatase [Podospora australis]
MSTPQTDKMQNTSIKTTFLIISDTHAGNRDANPIFIPGKTVPADVAIHCGDLTDHSKLEEFKNVLEMLRKINAPLKLVVPGNNDGKSAKKECIVLLEEGTHHFVLQNEANLTIYASPYTQGRNKNKKSGFRFNGCHDFNIPSNVDVVATHCPPRWVLDPNENPHRTKTTTCREYEILFPRISCVRPKLHCFGHDHQRWDAELITWRHGQAPSDGPLSLYDRVVDKEASVVIKDLNNYTKAEFREGKKHKRTSHCAGDERPIVQGRNILFVNAAIQPMSHRYPAQLLWLVDIDLSLHVDKTEPAEVVEGNVSIEEGISRLALRDK